MAKPEIKTVADLKGRQVVGPKGTVLHHLLNASLAQAGMNERDVKWVSMNLPASLTTLIGGRADAALVAAGGILAAQKAGFHELTRAKGVIETNLVLAARADFAQKYPDVVKRVAKVNREALQWALSNKQEALALGAAEHNISTDDAQKLFEWSNFYSNLSDRDRHALEVAQDFLLQQKMMSKPIDIDTLFWH